ncbi:Dihydrofolate reductase [Trichinella zimbabwensis]|uniref:dihydrofolate reductase n=1 Tax=Trichinella zimbabwensis TaxID=268475 RepID=A0A0V1HKX6_9BILA|nr:Dihydrofolate reductase [Trichinella zimbabwensis]
MAQINIIVAICEKYGVGKNNSLPWHLSKEIQHFKKMTTSVSDPNKINAVIMGRNTWNSIPVKFRPLSGRLNIIVSSTMPQVNEEDVIVISNWREAIEMVKHPLSEKFIETFWICGGAKLYKDVIESGLWNRLYVTWIMKEFDCDVFFSFPDKNTLKLVEDDRIPSDIQVEKDVENQNHSYCNQSCPPVDDDHHTQA